MLLLKLAINPPPSPPVLALSYKGGEFHGSREVAKGFVEKKSAEIPTSCKASTAALITKRPGDPVSSSTLVDGKIDVARLSHSLCVPFRFPPNKPLEEPKPSSTVPEAIRRKV